MFVKERLKGAAVEPGLRLLCPAKVNLYLKVLGRRPDGYHELVTVMQPLSLADELSLILDGPGITLECDHPQLPRDETNLVVKAAQSFARQTGRPLRARISLRKRIPVAAGLGGGSSDAAATLLALNALAREPLEPDRLHHLAASLGADVPFFLMGGPAVARGIGERLEPMTLPPYWYLLLNPGASLSTRWVYENLDLNRSAAVAPKEVWDPDHPEGWVHNDLQAVTLKRFPELGGLLARLEHLGARAQAVSGSGPTVFGLFPNRQTAQEAGRELSQTFSGWLALCRGLSLKDQDTTWESHTWTIC